MLHQRTVEQEPAVGSSRQQPAEAADRGMEEVAYHLSAHALGRWQAVAISVIVALSTGLQLLRHLVGDLPGLRFVSWFFFVDSEQTIPPLYSTLILLGCAAATGYIGWGVRPRANRWAWRALAALMAMAGLDEYAALHERAIEPLRSALAIDSGPLYYAWVVPGAAVVVVLAAGFSRFLLRLPADTRRRYLLAGFLFVAGAIGVEALGAGYVSGALGSIDPGVDPDAARENLVYLLFTTVEETLEMVGAAIFLTATIDHLDRHLDRRLALTTNSSVSNRVAGNDSDRTEPGVL